MFVYLPKRMHCLIIYSYTTDPSFSPCPWNLRSTEPSDLKILEVWRNLGFAMILFWINVMFIHGIKKCCYSFCTDINRIVLYGINLVSWIRHFIDLLHKKEKCCWYESLWGYFYIVVCHRKLFTGVSTNINFEHCDYVTMNMIYIWI